MCNILLILSIATVIMKIAAANPDTEKADFLNDMSKLVERCTKENKLKSDCYMACLYKGVNMIDDSGMFAAEAARRWSRKVALVSHDPTLIVDVATHCAHVNQLPVTDGKAGCQRASKLDSCIKQLEENNEMYWK